MREYLDPVYFQHPFQTGGSSSSEVGQHRYQSGGGNKSSSSSSVKKSNSVLNGGSGSISSGSVLGKFLKIAKSKSDVQGRPKSRASTYNGYDVEEDFRLSPSVLHRGPVEKMVHKSNSRKDVSRSHSWIYGSVKLPSDLPFGYGYAIGDQGSPGGSSEGSSGGGSSPSTRTHGMTALSIPRCQMVDYYNPSCDCNFTGDFDFLNAGPNNDESTNGGGGPCKACICEWTVSPSSKKGRSSSSKGGNKSSSDSFVSSVRKLTWKSLKQAVKKRPSLDNLKRSNTPNPFLSSSEVYSNPKGGNYSSGIPVVLGSHGDLLEGNGHGPSYYDGPTQAAFSAEELQPGNYFFPEKKNLYASCTELYKDGGGGPHVTASVRVRPKPSRQSWDFPTEYGPVPNYQEGSNEVYHSEWDLRQCIPYDVWVSTTSHVKPRATLSNNNNNGSSGGRSKTPTPESSSSKQSTTNGSLSKSTSVPYLAQSKSQSSKGSNGVMSSKSSSSINGKNASSSRGASADTLSVKSVGSSNGKGSYRSSTSSASNGVVKRPSILSSDVNAYQLIKAQTRNAKNSSTATSTSSSSAGATGRRNANTNKTARRNNGDETKEGGGGGDNLSDALSSSSDDLSDNVLTSESHMRIAGQKIYMAPNLNGNQTNNNSSNSNRGNVNHLNSSATKSGSVHARDTRQEQGKGSNNNNSNNRSRPISNAAVQIDEWSEDEEDSRMNKSQHVSNGNRGPNKGNKANCSVTRDDQTNYSNNGAQYTGSNNNSLGTVRVGQSQSSPSSSSSFHNNKITIGSNESSRISHNEEGRDLESSLKNNNNECLEFEEYEFEERPIPPSSKRTTSVNFHNGNKSSKATRELYSSREDEESCGNDLPTNNSNNVEMMRNPLANPNGQQLRAQSYVKKGQGGIMSNTNNNNIISTGGGGINSHSNGGSGQKLNNNNGLRRRKSRNGMSKDPGKLLREVIYEEELDDFEQSTTNEKGTGKSISSHEGIGGGNVHDSSQSSNKSSNEYAVKIVVSHTPGTSSSSEYVKPILKNRERVYDSPNANMNSSSSPRSNVGFGNNEIYFDSSVSSTSKKKVQFDHNKVIVCGGDSGPDSDEYSNHEDEVTRDNGNEEELPTTTIDCWKGNSSDARNYSNENYEREESGSDAVSWDCSRKGQLENTNDSNNACNEVGPTNQSIGELKQKGKSLFEEEVARKAASFAMSRSRKAAAAAEEEEEAAAKKKEEAIKNTSREECSYDGSVNNLPIGQVRLNDEMMKSNSGKTTNMTTFATARSNLKSISNSNHTTTTGAGGVGSNNKKPSTTSTMNVSRNSQGTGSSSALYKKKNPEPTQQPPCGNGDIKTQLNSKADIANKGSHTSVKPNNNANNTMSNKTSHGVTSNAMKTQRQITTEQNSRIQNALNEGRGGEAGQKIINPNSLLFNDTTRIRLNQSRPSLNETFKLNLTQNGSRTSGSSSSSVQSSGPVARSIRIKQSNSFRSIGSSPLRPREPPPPPPNVQKLNNSRLQKSISTSALAAAAAAASNERDVIMKRALSTNQLPNGHGSHYGNRLTLTKSEISLPIALQSTSSNQASTDVKNESIYGQKDNKAVNINGKTETNSCKSVTRSNTSRIKASTTLSGSVNGSGGGGGSRSKSLNDRCEALDKVLLGQQQQQNKGKANGSNQGNNKNCGGSQAQLRNNNNNNKIRNNVEGKVQKHLPQSGETFRMNSGQSATMGNNVSMALQTSLSSTMDGSQNIEIVTKENSVSEIRIYSTGNVNNKKGNNVVNNGEIYGATKTMISREDNNNGLNDSSAAAVEEIHYAATDLFPKNGFNLNGNNGFRKPAALPHISKTSSSEDSSAVRPQSTSVVLIIESKEGRNHQHVPSSPITYSQPIDTLTTQAPFKGLPPVPAPPAASSHKANEPNLISEIEEELLCEPLYDDVINHTYSADLTTKGLATTIGNKSSSSIISSISSRRSSSNGSRKSIPLDSTTTTTNRPSQIPPEPPLIAGQVLLSSTLPCMACPPSLPPPNLPSKNLSEFHNRPVILDEDDARGAGNNNSSFVDDTLSEQHLHQLMLDEEVDNLYNDISDGGMHNSSVNGGSNSSSNNGGNGTGKSLQSFASSMKGALLSAIKSMDFDRRSTISSASNNSSGSSATKKDNGDGTTSNSSNKREEDVIYDDTLSIRSSNCGSGSVAADTSRTYYHATFNAAVSKPQSELKYHHQSTMSGNQPLGNLIEQDEPLSDEAEDDGGSSRDGEPLYDDVINIPQNNSKANNKDEGNSDSGAESEDATPPPLPAQGPPIHLRSKIAAELPVIPFLPLGVTTNSKAFGDSGSEMSSREGSMEKVIGIVDYNNGGSKEQALTGEDALITKTRSLLNELNEKLSQLNIISPESVASSSSGQSPRGLLNVDFSSLSPTNNKPGGLNLLVSSSSESSGVEEDYNSEKNYSLSNTSDGSAASSGGSSAEENYKLAQVSKLVTETITMARGKFLNSMKSNMNGNGGSSLLILSPPGNNNNRSGETESPTEEPIYEEIGDLNHHGHNRPTSPIYSDAFDAKSIFDGASRNEILSFLESIRDRLTTTAESNSSGSQSSSVSSKKGHHNDSNSRNDSGIGPDALLALNNALLNAKENKTGILEANKDEASKIVLRKLCPDCNDVPVDNESNNNSKEGSSTNCPKGGIVLQNGITLCPSCNRKRSERKEIIMEIHETEMKYGRDLQIISEEFYKPIQIAGLLSKDQLDMIFLNVVELMEMSGQLTGLLKRDIESACTLRNDEELTSVNVGKIFLEIGESMMTAFQTYCTRQASAGALLAQLEKEKELLRIFLRVSQMENTVLRRMNLPAFLMVPVQRVTRYPLLLSRLLKVTPVDHFTREELQCAHEKIELHLEHMNKSTREVASVKLWRRISIINGNSTPLPRRATNDLEGASVSIRKMAVDVLDWASLQDVTCVMDNQLSVLHFNGKPLRGIYGCLLVRGKDLETIVPKMDDDMFFPPADDIVKEVKLVLVRVKNTRFCLLREPLCLSNCVISQGENEFQDFVEINEISSKNTYHLQGIDKQATANWLKYMQCYSMCVGQWRTRRIGLANIMMLKHL